MQPQSNHNDIKDEIQYLQLLFQNKQLDQFVERVEKYILPHFEKDSGNYKEKHKTTLSSTDKKAQVIQQKQKKSSQQQDLQNQIEDKVANSYEQSPKENLNLAKEQISRKQEPIKNIILNQKIFSMANQNNQQEIKQTILNSKLNILQKYDKMKLILFKIQRQMKKIQTPIKENKQWKVNNINATSSIAVKTKGTIVQIRYEGIVETNIFNLCVMIYLSQLYKQWVPFCTGSKTISQPTPLEKIVLMDLKIPFLTERYAYLHGIAVDRITKNGKLYIYVEGISHEKQLLKQIYKADAAEYQKKNSKSVVLDAKFMVCQIGNEGDGKYCVKVYGMLDSHMPLLPEKVVNYIVKQLGGMIFDKIVKRAKDIKKSPWQKQLEENQKRENKNKFYDWLNERIKNWDKTESIRKSKI